LDVFVPQIAPCQSPLWGTWVACGMNAMVTGSAVGLRAAPLMVSEVTGTPTYCSERLEMEMEL
jgi:hypothetical protein